MLSTLDHVGELGLFLIRIIYVYFVCSWYLVLSAVGDFKDFMQCARSFKMQNDKMS